MMPIDWLENVDLDWFKGKKIDKHSKFLDMLIRQDYDSGYGFITGPLCLLAGVFVWNTTPLRLSAITLIVLGVITFSLTFAYRFLFHSSIEKIKKIEDKLKEKKLNLIVDEVPTEVDIYDFLVDVVEEKKKQYKKIILSTVEDNEVQDELLKEYYELREALNEKED